jgi:hypothetical protein
MATILASIFESPKPSLPTIGMSKTWFRLTVAHLHNKPSRRNNL